MEFTNDKQLFFGKEYVNLYRCKGDTLGSYFIIGINKNLRSSSISFKLFSKFISQLGILSK